MRDKVPFSQVRSHIFMVITVTYIYDDMLA